MDSPNRKHGKHSKAYLREKESDPKSTDSRKSPPSDPFRRQEPVKPEDVIVNIKPQREFLTTTPGTAMSITNNEGIVFTDPDGTAYSPVTIRVEETCQCDVCTVVYSDPNDLMMIGTLTCVTGDWKVCGPCIVSLWNLRRPGDPFDAT